MTSARANRATAGAPQVAVAAVDLGASSGRVMVVRVSSDRRGTGSLTIREAHRFRNIPVSAGGTLHWDILRLYQEMLDGLRAAGRLAELAAIGIDSWGVDYGLLDSAGSLLGNPVHYRDTRTDGAMQRILAKVPAAELYKITGIQQLPINTICQLVAAAGTPQLGAASSLLLIPDLLAYWMTGEQGAEVTNASTTQLLDVHDKVWARSVIERSGIPGSIFPPLRRPGQVIGRLLPDVAAQAGVPADVKVVAVGSHDTASAVAAVPARSPHFAFISCGTWSLVGMELTDPVLTDDSRLANFSNEAGIDGTIRYLRNVVGLWLLQESMRAWSAAGQRAELTELLGQAAIMLPLRQVIDPDNPKFLTPGDMPARIAEECRITGQPVPQSPAETFRCILDSLALAHRHAIIQVQELSGRHADTVHVVGGGSRNDLLCQLTADACGLPVVAGPPESAAIGNGLVQARALGAAPLDLPGLRDVVRDGHRLKRYDPSGSTRPWQAAQRRLTGP